MKSILSIIISLLLILSFSGCKRKEYYKLNIRLNDTLGLIDSIIVSSENYIKILDDYDSVLYYDPLTKSFVFNEDSLDYGEYTFTIKTIFSKEQVFKFTLNSDTSFKIKNDIGLNIVNIVDKKELASADTIELVYTSDGCFHSFHEHLYIIKNKQDATYIVKKISDKLNAEGSPIEIQYGVSSSITESLFDIQVQSIIQKENAKQLASKSMFKVLMASTTVYRLNLLAKNKVFKFDDYGLQSWDLYEKLKKKYNIKEE